LTELDADMATNRFFIADTIEGYLYDAAISKQIVTGILTSNPGIKYWIVFAEIDEMAQGAAAALDGAGFTDTSWVSSFSEFRDTDIHLQWDDGEQSAWKSAIVIPQAIYTEPIFGALYAFMNGDATPETIFPEWKNVHEGTKYGSFAIRLLPFYELTFENYKHVLAWSDVYAESNNYPDYPRGGITRGTYPNSVPVPDSYK
jgi:hypothetical protein